MESIESIEATAAQVKALPIEVVRNVLWHAGDYNLGELGEPKVQRLLMLLEKADAEWVTKLSLVFEDYVNAWKASRDLWSHELLRQRVKALVLS